MVPGTGCGSLSQISYPGDDNWVNCMEKHVVGAENVVVKACTVAAVIVAAVDVVDDISSSLLVDFLLSNSYLR